MKNRFSILILDDVEENIYSLKLLIEEFDVDIYTALNARDAIGILMNNDIDLILSDIQMPDIDGFQFVEYIKGIDKLKDIPIIFITGIYDKDAYQQKGYDLGVIEYISKPIDVNLLSSKLKVYIDLFHKTKETKESLTEANKLVVHNTKMASIGEMIGVISHQLKQPLNILSLYCDDIKYSFEYGELDKAAIDDFSVNTKLQIHHMRDTIDGFLEFFKPTKEKSSFTIKKTLDGSFDLVDSMIKKNNVELELDLKEDFSLKGVEMELTQVLMNLVTNSIQAFEERGISDRKIKIEVYSKDDKNYLTFSDNAGGINEDDLEKIFDPYYTTKSEGTGIGLYMVKLVVKNSFEGNLTLENSNLGVKFIMEFDKGE
ncbi:hybrid sensor histidine kinase/response regulator [Halarcobacter ebronensis]|uniref:histidine kinase n=1 Tax=Halarcobacter ebronensis TaxID=1462615 RepID=A0A4V1LQR7_9BACT|nr:hybrid sensor histidine kinase/response regulator [Halarcobacter ebronensis]RXJ65638.1 hybrid sensor histidine kinase/response regulator [Halarcobacter ebronensis]